jgi:hypothetical protein
MFSVAWVLSKIRLEFDEMVLRVWLFVEIVVAAIMFPLHVA